MKKIILSYIFLISSITQSQEIITHTLYPPESEEITDLAVLNDELQGKQVVMLGEMTHMYGNIFEMKSRIVEYLHLELGFTTIAMESSMYDFYLMNLENPQFNPDAFNKAVFGVWSDTQEFQRLVNYIEKNNLKVIGFDSQIINNIPRYIEDFFRYCDDKKIQIKLNRDDFGIAIEEVLDAVIYEEEDIKFRNYEKELQRIIGRIENLNPSEENTLWLQLTKSLLASSRDAYYNTNPILTSDRANKQHNFRDAQMADNLLSYISNHSEEKIIVWADNIHVMNNTSGINAPVVSDFIPMGFYIKEELGNKVYSLATVHANDSLLERTTWHSTPILKDSFEEKLSSREEPYLYVSSNQPEMKKNQKHRLLSFIDFYDGNLSELHDGYIFIKNANLPVKEVNESQPEVPDDTVAAEIDNSRKKERMPAMIFKGQIIDGLTNEPIPFATLILLGQEVYRISDEEGNFEIKLEEKNSDGNKVSISSMGYETLEISLTGLTESIKLVPSFEELDKVYLTAYSTTPRKVLKKAIQEIKNNYPTQPLNFQRYGHFIRNKNDTTYLDIEVVTMDYTAGYDKNEPTYQSVEQVKWNTTKGKKPEYFYGFNGFRENAVQFSNILHKRKYKKFDLEFINSTKPEEENLYIIKFINKRDRFSYTNRWFPSSFSGVVYINKEDYAVVKVVETWENTALEEDMKDYEPWFGKFKEKLTFKYEQVSTYSKQENQKYYATEYFNRSYQERTDVNGNFYNSTFEGRSRLYNFRSNNIKILEYDNRKRDSAFDRLQYDNAFWQAYSENVPWNSSPTE